jgi:hypothetical protein
MNLELETETILPEPTDELNDEKVELETELKWTDLGLDDFIVPTPTHEAGK